MTSVCKWNTIGLSQKERRHTYEMNLPKLRGKIAEKGFSQNDISRLFGGCTRQTVSNKVSGKTPITLDEAQRLSELLNLTDQEKLDIFLS